LLGAAMPQKSPRDIPENPGSAQKCMKWDPSPESDGDSKGAVTDSFTKLTFGSIHDNPRAFNSIF
jgi:hypothetical protein